MIPLLSFILLFAFTVLCIIDKVVGSPVKDSDYELDNVQLPEYDSPVKYEL